MTNKSKRKKTLRSILFVFLLLLIIGGILSSRVYRMVFKPNVEIQSKEKVFLYIPSGSGYEDVLKLLKDGDYLKRVDDFEWLAKRKHYDNNVKAGRYLIKNGMNNNELVNMLRAGRQAPVKITFNNLRLKTQLAGKLALNLEIDSLSILNKLNDNGFLEKYGFNRETSRLMFIPNTYEIYWNTSVEELFERMYKEYKRFWNEERQSKASNMGFTPVEIGILASIVQQETNKTDEMSRIAGVYINRIKRGMPLQADPTVVFAMGDFSLKRILKRHLEYDSPYNTYKYEGLPPGPITLPSTTVIDKVLNYEKHDYLYFCAKDDFSGYHSFAKSLEQHNVNAKRYQQALSKRGIR